LSCKIFQLQDTDLPYAWPEFLFTARWFHNHFSVAHNNMFPNGFTSIHVKVISSPSLQNDII
jgi:hypothetical protein